MAEPKTILVYSAKGGCGKGQISDEIAFYYDRCGTPYNFYDLDGQGGDCHEPQEQDGAEVNIVDTPGYLSEDTRKWIDGSDVIVVPTKPTSRDIPPLQTTLDVIEAAGKAENTIIVINCFNHYTAAADFKEWLTGQYPNYKIYTVVQSELFVQASVQ